MKKIKFTFLLMPFYAAFVSCSSGNSGSVENGESKKTQIEGSISISGAFALYPLANVWAAEFGKEFPDVRLNISAGGAGKGMADVLTGASDLGMFSREITTAEKAKGVWWISVTKDAVLPTMSDKNPAGDQLRREGLTQKELSNIFLTDDRKQWKHSPAEIHVYIRSDAAGAAAVWAQYLGGKGQEALKGIAVYGDPGLAEAVKNDVKGIGFNNVNYAFDLNTGNAYPGIAIVPIDINGNGKIDPEENFYHTLDEVTSAIADGRYPAPPARELYFIAKGKPTNPAIVAFLKWVLGKGQNFVSENGYVKLSHKVIEAQKQKF